MVRLGGWLFKHRTWLPLPLAAAILLIPSSGSASPAWFTAGLALVAGGELLRIWGVGHIGVISRTRSDRLGPLIATGPFAYTRNPLYIGNIALWVGFALSAQLPWLAPLVAVVLAFEYHAIVRWEETLLESRLGAAYRDYAARVPRWLPFVYSTFAPTRRHEGTKPRTASDGTRAAFTWRETLFSERGTLIAIAAAYLLLWIKARF